MRTSTLPLQSSSRATIHSSSSTISLARQSTGSPKIKPYGDFYTTVAYYRLQASPILQPFSNQIRTLIGYGSETRKGFNVAAGVSYDIQNNALQNQVVQVSYNGSCCGIAVEYRRIALGQVRTENQFRVAFIIANIGNFGNLRRQDKIF